MRRDEEAKAHEATRGQSPPLRGRCSWKTPPLTASFLTSPRSQTGALPAPAFLSCWRAYPQHGSQERQTTEEVRRSQEEHTSHAGGRQKRGPKPLPPAGRPAVHPLGRHRATAAASSRALPALGSPKARCKSASEQQESKPGLEAGTKRTASAGREAPGRDAALSRRSHSESGALREGSHRSQAASTAPSRSSSRQPSGAGTAASPPAAARGQPPPRAAPRRPAPLRPPRPAAIPSELPAPPRVPGRPQSPLRGTRAEPKTGTKESRAARTHRPPSLRRTERTQRPPHPDRLREGRREPPRRGSGKEREAEAEAEAEADSAPAGLRQHRGGRRSAARLRSAPPRAEILSATPTGRAHSFLNTAGRVIGREDDGRWGRPRPAGRDWATRMPIPIGAVGG